MAGPNLRMCYQFADSGSCSYGASCKFSHNTARSSGKGRAAKKTIPKVSQANSRRANLDPIAAFFKSYGFKYRKDRPIMDELYRMFDYFEWEREDSDRAEARDKFKTAMVLRFNDLYGMDVDSLDCWHRLCLAVNIDPLPSDVAGCKKKVRKVYVNLVDLVETSGKDAELFDNLKDLQDYTNDSGKYFPKASAYAGGVLKFLLRQIL